MPTSLPAPTETSATVGGSRATWAPWWVLVYVATWPWNGIAQLVLSLGAVVGLIWLGVYRFRGGDALLSREAWALTTVMFFSYWLPELFSSTDAIRPWTGVYEVLKDVRLLPFLWLVAIAVHRKSDRRIVYAGISIIAIAWSLDGLVQAVTGFSVGGPPGYDRISGIFGARHPHLGQALATLAAFPLGIAAKRAGMLGWLGAALLVGAVVLLSGSRASWITFALVLLLSGWQLLGWKRMSGVFAAGALALVVLTLVFPRDLRDRISRTEEVFSGDERGLDQALSGRVRIWEAAACMIREHPINGVGIREYRDAYPACEPKTLGRPVWGEGGALHAHQIVLEILCETGILGLMLWLVGAGIAWRAWRLADAAARLRAAMPARALWVTVFPLNTHLAFYSSFWGGVTLLLVGLYVGALFGDDAAPGDTALQTPA